MLSSHKNSTGKWFEVAVDKATFVLSSVSESQALSSGAQLTPSVKRVVP